MLGAVVGVRVDMTIVGVYLSDVEVLIGSRECDRDTLACMYVHAQLGTGTDAEIDNPDIG